MFYGGFSTNWKKAKAIAPKSILLSTVGVLITAALTGLFCHFVLKIGLLEGLLMGSVIASTDAASVISILRSRKLKLKNDIDLLLELESGSNDPVAYMLTIILLTLMVNTSSGADILGIIFGQVIFGILVGGVLSKVAVTFLRKVEFEIQGLYPLFIMAIAILSYSVSDLIGGNGFLSVYLAGMIIGNSKIPHKKSLDHFFDGVCWIMQITLFFILGLVSFPSQISYVVFEGISISIFMILVARPVAVFSILSWFKVPIKEQLFISWVGLRGAASLVFAIVALNYNSEMTTDIFHIIFFIALFSVAIQGSLLPKLAEKLNIVEHGKPEPKAYDELGGVWTNLVEVKIDEKHIWANKALMDAEIPDKILIVMIKRDNGVIVPKGLTTILPQDTLVVTGESPEVIKSLVG